jgi:hypothetical protein
MKFIIAVLILVMGGQFIGNLTEGTILFDAVAIVMGVSVLYVMYKVFKFVFSGSTSTNTADTSTITTPKHERRPVIHAEGSTQIVRQERLGFEKWKVVMGTFGSNGQRKEVGSMTITPSNPTFSSGGDNFSVTWA